MKITNHKLENAQQWLSPNHNERPAECEISLVVMHGISLPPGEFGGSWVHELFMNTLDFEQHPYLQQIRGIEVSAHLLIRRDGELHQYVPFDKRAWHAGLSVFCGREKCNDFSIGIEMEGADDVPYTEQQYDSLLKVLRALYDHYPGVAASGVVGHCDIAPGRKTDPGPSFDWLRLATHGFVRATAELE